MKVSVVNSKNNGLLEGNSFPVWLYEDPMPVDVQWMVNVLGLKTSWKEENLNSMQLWDSIVLSTGKVACKLASFASDHESFSLKKGKDSMQVYHKDKMVSYGSACQASNKKACDVEVRVRNNSSGGLFKLNMGNDVGELSKSDKVKENWHSFLKKKSLDVSKCGAKLSCENKSVLVDSGIVDRMGLFLNSNFLKGDRAILKSEGGSDFGNPSRGVEESSVSRKGVGSKGSSSCAKEIRSRINSLKSDIGPNKFQSNIGGELISCSDNASKPYPTITIPVKWGDNDDTIKYSKRRNGRDYCLVVKGYGMKLRSSKNCLNLSWNLEKEISKVIDFGIAVGFDFNDKEVKMADIIDKAYSKLMGIKLKMANAQ
ncbi:hypothetical protein LWI29_006619 [Acer saccharum]|uniref:Uncharacterized protein n=1 Tax=Acer saccharum TaxID=4024 RepID=A0AA39VYK1_ACESA|nr:hypothetical protein LWI29_006619 [Acer saccharum]